jgi:hypothetical protein
VAWREVRKLIASSRQTLITQADVNFDSLLSKAAKSVKKTLKLSRQSFKRDKRSAVRKMTVLEGAVEG